MSVLISNLNTIESVKLDIKSAIEAKGVSMSGVSFPDYPSAIASIQTGITMEDYIGNTVSVLTGSATSVPTNRFAAVFYLKSVDLPECIEIGNSAFTSCTQLESVHLSECTTIGARGFYNCTSLSDVNIPKCTRLGSYAFTDCVNLESVNFPELVYIGASYDSNSSVKAYPGTFAFSGCINLTTVNLPKCEHIYNGVFSNCSSLSVISLPNCKHLGVNVFTGQSDLSVYLMGSVVPRIYSSAVFNDITGTLSIYVPESLYSLYQASSNWWDRYSSNIVSVPEPEIAFDSVTGTIYGKMSGTLNAWTTYSELSLSILDDYKIRAVSLSNCTGVVNDAFADCPNLSYVSLPNCSSIGSSAFYRCSSLETLYVPSLEYLEGGVISGCTKLSILELPVCSNINNEWYFYTGIDSLVLGYSTDVVWNRGYVSSNMPRFVEVYVPASLVEEYKSAPIWSMMYERGCLSFYSIQ